MKKLIIGGAGFIGSVLVKRMLEEKKNLIVIDKLSLGSTNFIDTNRLEFHKIDINDINEVLRLLDEQTIDEVWHLAANSNIPLGIDDINVDLNDTFKSTVSTLEIMKQISCKKIFFHLVLLFMV